ncbi:hypothetical protein GA0070604_4146 [Micromonospora eburnea]|uniref:Uncharacterized protein n=1 Tax=Micromonospora eburnea TaxID=227316 RepID=A0A1C6V0L4_9ACTN|nr:hypothetical protein GA0070604_4146 [Micromonospora eburnea]
MIVRGAGRESAAPDRRHSQRRCQRPTGGVRACASRPGSRSSSIRTGERPNGRAGVSPVGSPQTGRPLASAAPGARRRRGPRGVLRPSVADPAAGDDHGDERRGSRADARTRRQTVGAATTDKRAPGPPTDQRPAHRDQPGLVRLVSVYTMMDPGSATRVDDLGAEVVRVERRRRVGAGTAWGTAGRSSSVPPCPWRISSGGVGVLSGTDNWPVTPAPSPGSQRGSVPDRQLRPGDRGHQRTKR